MRATTGWIAFALLFGGVAGFATGKNGRLAEADTIDNKTTRWLAGTIGYAAGQDVFLLFDSQTNRLLAYTVSGAKELELLAVREVSYDLKPVTWGKQKPPVQELKEAWEKSERERRDRERLPDRPPEKKP
ncbi:MAG: hypothetical protein HY716_14395 [Planctomycetes bacterium]|nr:hypothetical protein [Planctomycetota bacterium]